MSQQLISLAAVMMLRNIDLTGYVTEIRIAYAVSQAICLIIWILVFLKVSKLPEGGKKIKIPALIQLGKEVKPSKESSVQEHDMDCWKEEMQKIGLGLIIVSGMHMYWEALVPLVLQSIMIPVGVFGNNLFKCHVLNMNVDRPFPSTQPFTTSGDAPEAEKTEKTKAVKKKD
jgi:hypothetical protein